MKAMRKVGAVLLAMLAMVCFAVPAFAVPGDDYARPFSITIENKSDAVTMEGVTFEAYKLFDVTYSDATPDADTAYAYTLADEFADFVPWTPAGGAEITTSAELVEYISGLQPNSAQLNEFATAIRTYATEHTIAPGGTVEGTTANRVIITVTDPGYYLVVAADNVPSTADPNVTVTALAALTTTNPTPTIELKADAPTIEKKVRENQNATWDDVADYNVGDSVEFLLTGTVPTQLTGYTNYYYRFHDTLSEGLTVNRDSIVVYREGGLEAGGTFNEDAVVEPSNYTVEFTGLGDGCDMHVTLNSAYVMAHPGEHVYVYYTAEVNEDALISNNVTIDPNTNTANIEFSNNPYNDDERDKTPDDEVRVYSYGFNVFKHDDENHPLAGAEFMLYTDSDCQHEVLLVADGDNTYRVATDDEAGAVIHSITTDETGTFVINGLDAGTYYLKELTPPDGYYALDDPIKVTITAVRGDAAGEQVVNKVQISQDDTTDVAQVSVLNSTSPLLPTTGGMGTTIFYVVGAVLVVGAGVGVVVKRRMAAK
ncbi:SpaH/EbpB family LPXTG-anchored major pilin [Enorma massiliensis]|uniref:SpaH/EbpB family LPXTG-anchored major pilin n=1 Tax=Enorma massiliensis TaxID=1472761 RepID=UPI003AF14DAC